jgi:Meiotically Up-regulated Gene 113 (MUG113) protein
MRMSKLVYFIQSGNAIKIGSTRNLLQRACILQDHNPNPIKILGVYEPAKRDTERKIQQTFKEFHMFGEWFFAAPQILEYIRNNATGCASKTEELALMYTRSKHWQPIKGNRQKWMKAQL